MAVPPRERFEAIADAYERSRPGYPVELLDHLSMGVARIRVTAALVCRSH
jgi:hypothetical protein